MNRKSIVQQDHKRWGVLGQSLLNSMIGEYLEKEKNPLAMQMGFYHHDKKLSLDASFPQQFRAPITSKVLIFVNGLTSLESVWDYPKEGSSSASIVSHYIDICFDSNEQTPHENYGQQLHKEFGFTPLYLRYNTGLSLEKNGLNFSEQLSQLFSAYPIEINDLMLVGFSGGGALLSHTQNIAQSSEQRWLKALSKCVYLGNPNQGSIASNMIYLSGDFFRHLPIYYVSLLADWLDYRLNKKQALPSNTHANAEEERKRPSANSYFLASSRHYFISGGTQDRRHNVFNQNMTNNALCSQVNKAPSYKPINVRSAHLSGTSPVRLAHSEKVYALIANWINKEESIQPYETNYYQQPASQLVSVEEQNRDTSPTIDSTSKTFVAGTVDFMASAYDKTIEKIETMHYSIAEEPFYALEKLPIASQIAKPFEAIHRDTLDTFYRSLRNGGRMIHKVAADMVTD